MSEEQKEIVIVGCGAGGGSSAQFAKKTNRKAKITIFEKGTYPQYSKCGLPYTISGEIPEFKDLIEFTEEWFKKRDIDLQLNTTVEDIDKKNKKLTVKKNGEKKEKKYDSLIIATGAKPFIPPIENIKKNGDLKKNINVVRTIDDAKKIAKQLKKTKRATIIGAGFIGLEIADCLHKKNIEVCIVEALPYILPGTFDKDMAKQIQKKIPDDIKFYTNCTASKLIENKKGIQKIVIKNKENDEEKELDTDLVIIAAGTKPNVDLAKKAGCKIGDTNRIQVNEKSETTVEDIYAVGDCTEYKNFITNKPTPVGLGSIVVRQGIAAGINAADGN
ncbi:MAG: FAD-dependent oxidoreductase, partial [Candidatus Thermoplasmatota archaeon]